MQKVCRSIHIYMYEYTFLYIQISMYIIYIYIYQTMVVFFLVFAYIQANVCAANPYAYGPRLFIPRG